MGPGVGKALTRLLSGQMSTVRVKVLGGRKEVAKVVLEVVKSGAGCSYANISKCWLSVELGSFGEVQLLCGATAGRWELPRPGKAPRILLWSCLELS